MKNPRRTFLLGAAGAASTALLHRVTLAQGTPMLPESDPQAVALGYKMDATKADKAKFPKYAPGQMCGNCQLYQGKPTDAMAPCPIFGNRQVMAKGWCSAWVAKG